MEKKFSKFELARLKRTAQNVEQFVAKKNRLVAQINKIQAELDEINNMIELTDAPTVAMTGYHSEEIIKKVVTPTDKLDKNGNILKQTTFEFIYPDTIVPPVTAEHVDKAVSEEPIAEETTDSVDEKTVLDY